MSDLESQVAEQHVEVAVADLDRVPVQVAVSALPTVFTLIRDTFQDGRRGTPAAIRNGLLSHLRSRDVAAFSPVVQASGWPSLLDGVRGPRETLDDAADRLASMSGATLLDALEADTDVQISEWTAVQRDPDRWLRRYVDVLYRGWSGSSRCGAARARCSNGRSSASRRRWSAASRTASCSTRSRRGRRSTGTRCGSGRRPRSRCATTSTSPRRA